MLKPGGKNESRLPDGEGQSADDHDAMMHRVRVGITGLAVVFLLTVLAAAMLSLLGPVDRGTTRLANGAVVTNGTLAPDAPREPLAELGVAPGNLPAGNSAAPAPKRVPAPVAPVPTQPHR